MPSRKPLALGAVLALLLTLALTAVAQAAPPQARRAVPAGWQVYRGPDGLVLFHPQGWRVQRAQEGSFLVSAPGAEAIVLMQPMRIEGRAQGVVQGLGQVFPELFPGLGVSQLQTVSQNPEVAQGRLEYQVQGQPYRGWAMCFQQGGQGVVYALASRASDWPGQQQVLKDILRGFFYAAPAGAPATPKGAAPGLPPMVEFRDPVEGAFTCPVPQGWKVEGGTRRHHAVDVRPELVAQSPDGGILIRLGDAQVPPMVMANQMLSATGFREGSWYSPGYGLQQMVMRYLPGAEFITKYYLPKRVGQVSGVQARQLSDLSRQMQAIYQRAGLPMRVDAGEAVFQTTRDGGPRKGYVYAQTLAATAPGSPGMGTWMMEKLAGYLAAPGQEALAEAVFLAMAAGFQIDPQWHARQSRTTGQVSEIVTRTNNEIQGIIKSTFEYRQRTQDRAMEKYDREAIRGQVLIEDPNTGQRYEVPNGSNYYWKRTGTDSFVGTDADNRPTSPNYWFERMRIVD
ncbi:MAG: hypothetical protein HY794_14245 [Desulfarculus sp.]|nr:hypothetical protein [Desulfarculus sp.]